MEGSNQDSTIRLTVRTPELKDVLALLAKSICGGLGGCSGFFYVIPAFTIVEELTGSKVGGIIAGGATLTAVSSYAGWGGIECINEIMPARIKAFVSEKKIGCYNQVIYPIGIIGIGMSSLIPIGYLMYLVNGADNRVLFFVPLATDSWLRVVSLHRSFLQIQPSRKFLNLFRTVEENEHPEILSDFLQQLHIMSNYYLQILDQEMLSRLLAEEPVVQNAVGRLSFTNDWKIALKIMLDKTIEMQAQRKNIYLMKKVFSYYLMRTGGLFSAASLVAMELYLSFLAAGEITSNVYLKSTIALGAVGPIGYLQYLLIAGIWGGFYEELIAKLYRVSTPSWLMHINPFASRMRIGIATSIAAVSWGHILVVLNDLFPNGWLRALALATILPSNCLLLLAAMLELSEKLHIFLTSKFSRHAEMAELHYKIGLLIREIESADPNSEMLKSLTEEVTDLIASAPIELSSYIASDPIEQPSSITEEVNDIISDDPIAHPSPVVLEESSSEIVIEFPHIPAASSVANSKTSSEHQAYQPGLMKKIMKEDWRKEQETKNTPVDPVTTERRSWLPFSFCSLM